MNLKHFIERIQEHTLFVDSYCRALLFDSTHSFNSSSILSQRYIRSSSILEGELIALRVLLITNPSLYNSDYESILGDFEQRSLELFLNPSLDSHINFLTELSTFLDEFKKSLL